MRIIARSRIGFWTAFETSEGTFLNLRGENGEPLSIVLTAADVALLADAAEICHPHARRLARSGQRLDVALTTPSRGTNEPEPHEWQPRKPISTSAMLKAA
jgi:hypothetical protein